jgi:hypothetical protein
MSKCLSYALDLGLPVFPCWDTPANKKTDKTPLTKNGFYDAVTDPAKIREMFTRPCLVGVPTGSVSGVDVLDVDPRNGGREWYEAHKGKLPATRAHRTRSGGLHLLFKHLDGLRCSTSKIAPGIDVRADGGYIIWWPAAGLEFKEYPPAGLPEWPLWLLPSMMSRPVAPPRPYPRQTFENKSMERQIEGLIKTVANAPEGERNSITYWAACRAGELVAAGQMGAGLAIEIITVAAVRSGLPNFEAKKTAESGVTGGRVARQSGWKRCGELDGQFGGRGEEMIVAPRQ